MATVKPVRGFSSSYWVPKFTLELQDEQTLYGLIGVTDDESKRYLRESIENAISDFNGQETNFRQSPTPSQVRVALKRFAADSKRMYEFLCHPGAHGKHNHLDGRSRQLIALALHQCHLNTDAIRTAKDALSALWRAAKHAESMHLKEHASKLKGGRRPDSNMNELVERILHVVNEIDPRLTKTKQNFILKTVLTLAHATCSEKTIEGIRRRITGKTSLWNG